jgi:hypothetical protein
MKITSTQKAILKATLLMPIMVPLGYIKLGWRKIFPKKDTIKPEN